MTGRPGRVDDGQLADEGCLEQCARPGLGMVAMTWTPGMSSVASADRLVLLHCSTFCRASATGDRAVPCRAHARDARTASLIHARGLTKRFGEFTAVDAIDFDVAPGESFGFLGPERRRQDLDDADDRLRLAGHRRHPAGHGHGPGDRRPADPRAARRGARSRTRSTPS